MDQLPRGRSHDHDEDEASDGATGSSVTQSPISYARQASSCSAASSTGSLAALLAADEARRRDDSNSSVGDGKESANDTDNGVRLATDTSVEGSSPKNTHHTSDKPESPADPISSTNKKTMEETPSNVISVTEVKKKWGFQKSKGASPTPLSPTEAAAPITPKNHGDKTSERTPTLLSVPAVAAPPARGEEKVLESKPVPVASTVPSKMWKPKATIPTDKTTITVPPSVSSSLKAPATRAVGNKYQPKQESNRQPQPTTKLSVPVDMMSGHHIFVPHEKFVFCPAILLHNDVEKHTMQVNMPLFDDESKIVAASTNTNLYFYGNATGWNQVTMPSTDTLWYQNRDDAGQWQPNIPDMQTFESLHEAGILYNLKYRHAHHKPYTRCGDLVVSVNPFQWLPHLYNTAQQLYYAKQLVWRNCDTDPRRGLEPHVYEVSSLAYKGLAFNEGLDQSVLITGESGSGKTETAKIIMNHIASIQRGPVDENEEISNNNTNINSNKGKSWSGEKSKSCNAKTTSTTPTNTTASTTPDVSKPAVPDEVFSPIVQRILESNPLLEAFGNAQTVRNDNSSRFGKFTRLQFDKGDPDLRRYNLRTKALCVLAGSKCEVYLLEKNRVVQHAADERAYHIFYQMLAADDNKKSLFWKGLVGKHMEDFKYVGPTETTTIEGISDEDKFTETLAALGNVGVRGKNLTMFFKGICIVLQLGNIIFEEDPNNSDKCVITSKEAFGELAELVGIDETELAMCFLQRTMETRDEVLKVPRNADAAKEAADSFAKEIYSKTFLWLVRAINDATCAEINYLENDTEDFGIIGLLDIFGFESFKTNTFGQLCINYANEKLQQKAVNDIFLATKEEYDFEGIPLDNVDYIDNEAVLKVIEGRNGLVSLLNEQCYRPKGDDRAFVSNAIKSHKESKVIFEGKGKTPQFVIVHYAGTVIYEATNFVKSNQDTLPLDLSLASRKSSNEILSEHLENDANMNPLPESAKNKLKKPKPPVIVTGFQHFNRTCNANVNPKALLKAQSMPVEAHHDTVLDKSDHSLTESGPSHKMKTPKRHISRDLMAETVWTKYQKQLTHLMDMLATTQTRYVRCIKPNQGKQPKILDHKSVTEQLRCAGIAPTVALSCATYPNKLSNGILRFRYQNMWDQEKFPSKASPSDSSEVRYKKDCEALLACALKPSQYVVGKTKTFFARGALEHLDSNRVQELDALATVIQTRARGCLTRLRQERIRINTPRIQRWYRMAVALRKLRAMAKRRRFLEAKNFWK